MKSFSEKRGLDPNKLNIQKTTISPSLRNSLWNIIYTNDFLPFSQEYQYSHQAFNNINSSLRGLAFSLWANYYDRGFDEEFDMHFIIELTKETIYREEYNRVYDLLQFIPNNFGSDESLPAKEDEKNIEFCKGCNRALESHLSAYRFVDMEIADLTSEEEIETVEKALNDENVYSPVKIHLKDAIRLLSDFEHPNYRNSIKDSISAVESYCSLITGKNKSSLDNGLAYLEKYHNLPSSLKSAFLKLYAYTSNTDGIRHALMEESNLGQEDAKYMLVICSAFINYLTAKSVKNLAISASRDL